MPSRRGYRVAFAVLVVGSLLVVVGQPLAAVASGGNGAGAGTSLEEARAPPRDDVTVIATDSNSWLGESSDGPRANAELIAFAPNGSVAYYDDSHTRYWDVDPVPGSPMTVEYVYADHLDAAACGGDPSPHDACTRNGVERVNLTTGAVTPVYSRITPGKHSTRWHDVDRIDADRIAIADIALDRVVIVNTTTELIEWEWDVQRDFPVSSGGPYPRDWTHLNDVEVLDDGRLLASLRNQDQVVFLDRETGFVEDWTLGADDDHATLYEQHNPDYLPTSQGGPAVLVADSESNRLVEYQRADGGWERSWTWRDARLQWPRDADRLPNGHTLVTDSNGNRVFELDANGEIVWSVDVAFPYEAERLGTGDESAGGPSARSADLASRDPGAGDAGRVGSRERLWLSIKDRLAGPTFNAAMYVLPVWMGPAEVIAAIVLVVTLAVWTILEWRWSELTVGLQSPFRFDRKQ